MGYLLNHLEAVIVIGLLLFAALRIHKHNRAQQIAQKLLKEALSSESAIPLTLHPDIDPSKCTGCAACTKVCPEGDILQMVNNKAVLVGPLKCVGHGECERACPMGAITLVFGSKTRGVDIPRLSIHYETNVRGLYIAGELGGMGLIRNAVKQGALAATHALSTLPLKKTGKYDLLIVGSGPAGLSAGLAAIAHKKSYAIIEQNSFGGTVFNYPRQKVVMTHSAELPIFGKMRFPSNEVSKEELLAYWNKLRKMANIQIAEKTRFEDLKQEGNHFVVHTNKAIFTASKVILAMGLRGTPKKLGLENEDLPKVTYNLIDPEQYQNSRICVVGSGNAGVEAAQKLAEPVLKNKVKLLVRSKTLDRCNEENRMQIEMMQTQGLVDIWYESGIVKIEKDHLIIKREEKHLKVRNNFLFIFAGAEIPFKFLMSLGIQMDKKFGEGLRKIS